MDFKVGDMVISLVEDIDLVKGDVYRVEKNFKVSAFWF